MSISKSLIDKFAKIINSSTKEPEKEQYFYGEVKMDGNIKCVQLDGSDVKTPIDEVADAQVGDRVMVLLNNHTAAIVGNQTCPASARTATDYITQNPEDGSLEIGNTSSGSKNKLSSDGMYIYDENNKQLAAFLGDKIQLNDAEIIKETESDTLWIKNGDGSIGFLLNEEDASQQSFSEAKMFLNVTKDSFPSKAYAMLETREANSKGAGTRLSLLPQHAILYSSASGANGTIDLQNSVLEITLSNLIKNDGSGMHIEHWDDMKVKIDKDGVKINDANVLTNSPPLFKTGNIVVTCNNGTVTYTGASNVIVSNPIVPGYSGVSFTITPIIDNGYTVVGLPRITTNFTNAFQLTSYSIDSNDNNKIYVWYHNAGSGEATNTTLRIDWFAVRNSNLNV